MLHFLNAIKRLGYQGTITIKADIPKDWNAAYSKAAVVLKDVYLRETQVF